MAKSTRAVYRTSDGKEFATFEEANIHEGLIEATDVLEKAQRAFFKATAATLKTADGYPFGQNYDYYYVEDGLFGIPDIIHITIPIWQDCYQIDDQGDLILIKNNGMQSPKYYKICRLYKSEKAALKTKLRMMEKTVECINKEAEQVKQEIANHRA